MESRLSFYRDVHKGIRSFLLDLTVAAGRLEWNDAAQVAIFREQAELTFRLLSGHAHHENEYVAPLLDEAAPHVARILGDNHQDQEVTLDRLQNQLRAINCSSDEAAIAGHRFVVAISRFAGESLVHMADEEEIAMPAIWGAFDDATILRTHNALVGSIAPDEMAAVLRWMLPAMNATERVQMLEGIRSTAPQPVFAFVRGIAREVLTESQNDALDRALAEVSHA